VAQRGFLLTHQDSEVVSMYHHIMSMRGRIYLKKIMVLMSLWTQMIYNTTNMYYRWVEGAYHPMQSMRTPGVGYKHTDPSPRPKHFYYMHNPILKLDTLLVHEHVAYASPEWSNI
ncbi:hypothetical protein HAX54_031248, partial [Datura stramonium]|nr:hypothetical protein [Datura stramonium]